MTLIEYIKSSIDIIVTLKVEEQLALERLEIEEDNENSAKNYETLLKKEESEIRQHISVYLYSLYLIIDWISNEASFRKACRSNRRTRKRKRSYSKENSKLKIA